METSATPSEAIFHVRAIFGVVIGLSIAHLLGGLARLVQHPGSKRVYSVHLGWVAFLFTSVIHFWWFEFGLAYVEKWTFQHYLFIITYAALFYFTCAILFPDRMDEYSSYAAYFHSRQKWFYGLLASLFAIDVADTLWKGTDHLQSLGPEYLIRQASMCAAAVVAMFVSNRRFHLVLVLVMLAFQFYWILTRYKVLG
ncbi:MAG: hypothetical protein ACQETX_12930 [Pseudomonadota bacterium]